MPGGFVVTAVFLGELLEGVNPLFELEEAGSWPMRSHATGSTPIPLGELTAVEALAQNQTSSSRSRSPLRDGYFLQAIVGGRYG